MIAMIGCPSSYAVGAPSTADPCGTPQPASLSFVFDGFPLAVFFQSIRIIFKLRRQVPNRIPFDLEPFSPKIVPGVVPGVPIGVHIAFARGNGSAVGYDGGRSCDNFVFCIIGVMDIIYASLEREHLDGFLSHVNVENRARFCNDVSERRCSLDDRVAALVVEARDA